MAAILMTKEDQERWIGPLTEYYRGSGIPEEKIKGTIEEIFAAAQVGWARAPRDLDTRIKVKSGFQCKSHANLKPRRKVVPEIEVQDQEEVNQDDSLFDTMTKTEKDWWGIRISEYSLDFDFNSSSDKPLIEQLLVEELVQKRLFKLQIRYPDKDYSKRMNDGLKRIGDVQTKLGITREQRAGILNKIDGNVAKIASELDEKLKLMPEKMLADYKEELYYNHLKSQRPPVNILPPIEKVEAMLNIDGKISANFSGDKISEITEAMGKEIAEKKELPPKKELPDGVDVS